MRSRTLMTPVGALVATTLALAACGGPAAPSDAQRTEATIAVFQELNSIDPPIAVDSNSAVVINNVYEGLYRLDGSNQPVPAAAAALPDVSEDGLTYTIALNPDDRWSDGTPVTAHDFVYAWQRAVGLDNAAENQKYFGAIAGATDIIAGKADPSTLGVSAIDDETLEIRLATPTSYFTSSLAVVPFFPLNREYVESQGEGFGSDAEHALYNGPFVLADYAGPGVGGDWSYVKNENYWDAAAVRLDRINVRVVKETNTAINLFRSGQLDQVLISGAAVQAEANNAAFVSDTTSTTAFLGYNHTNPALANPKVRQAISLVIDREALAANVLADGSTAATGLIPPGLASAPGTGTDFAEAAGDLLPTDVGQARALWAEARSELGIASLDLVLETFDADRVRVVSEYLKGAIEASLDGVSVTIGLNPVANFLEKTKGGSFDLFLVTWAADYADPSSQLGLSASTAGTNWGKYSNPDFDAALNAARTTHATDPEARWADLLEAQRLLIADQGITPIYFQSSTLLRNPALKGVLFHSSGPAFSYKTAHFAE